MPNNLGKFSQRMFGLSKKVERNANQIVKDVATTFVEEVIPATPVDVGTAVSNWKVGLNYSPTGEREAFSPGSHGSTADANASAALAEAKAKIEARQTNQTIYVVNSAGHIDLLNAGWSAQAPAGFIEAAYDNAVGTLRKSKVLK